MGREVFPLIELTQQQQQAMDAGSVPLRFINPRTNRTLVLIDTEAYERIKGFLDEDEGLTMRQVAALVERAMREEDADDPTLAFYQQEYGKKP